MTGCIRGLITAVPPGRAVTDILTDLGWSSHPGDWTARQAQLPAAS